MALGPSRGIPMQVKVNGVGIRYQLEGPVGAPVVTLAHPLGARLELWEAQAAALRDRYRVLRYDARGHGGSDVPPGPYTLDQMAADLRGLLEALDLPATHLVGLSMGGCAAMVLARQHPRRVRSLVLADTTTRYASHTAAMWADRVRTAETAGMEPIVEPTMAIWFTAGFRERDRAAVDGVRAMLRTTDPRGYVAAIHAIKDVDLTEAVAAIGCPTLVVVGEQDPGTPPAMARVIQDRIPGARLVVLPGAAHCSAVEAAGDFNRALLEFLAGAG